MHGEDYHQRSTWTAASNHGGHASGGAAWPEQAAGCADTDIPTHHVSAPGKSQVFHKNVIHTR